MMAFFTAVLRDKWKIWAIYVISTVSCLETYIAIYPSLASQAAAFSSALQMLPEQFYAAFNMSASMLSFNSLESYLSTEYMSLLWPVMAILLAIPIANHLIAGDIDRGTIEAVVSLPVSRTRLFVERYLAGFLLMEAFTALTVLGAIPLAHFQNITLSSGRCWTAFWFSALFAWAVYSLAIAASTVSSGRRQASLLSGGILFVMYFINVLAGLTKNLENLKYFSFFHYFDGTKAFASSTISSSSVAVMLSCTLVLTAFAVIWFRWRDLSV